MQFMADPEFWSMVGAAFLAATIIPFSSELSLTGMVLAGYDPITLLVGATVGNTLGGMTGYALGRMGSFSMIERWFRIKPNRLEQLKQQYGAQASYLGLISWVPIIGDPLTIVMGLMRVNPWIAVFTMALSKGGRYAIVLSVIARSGL